MLPVPSDFCTGLTLDSTLLLQDIASGKPVPISEALSLASAAQTIYISTVLESRTLGSVDQRHELWRELSQLLGEVIQTWGNIDSNDQQIRWLVSRLEHFWLLARDQMELYKISMAERVAHSKKRGDIDIEPFSVRNSVEPDGYSNSSSTPQHVYQIGRL